MSQQGQLHNVGSGAAAIETLTGNVGGPVGPDASFNINIVGNTTSGINVVGTPGTNTLTIVSTYYSLTPFIVGTDSHAQYATIQSAITAATAAGASSSAPANVYIKPGTYTENLTLADGVNLVGFGSEGAIPSVIINGKCSATFSGFCSIEGVCLKTNGDYAISLTGGNAPFVSISNCSFVSTAGQTNINVTGTSGCVLDIYKCIDNVTGNTLTNALFNISAAAGQNSLRFFNCVFIGTITGTQSTIGVGGSVQVYNSYFGYPIITAAGATSIGIFNSYCFGLSNSLMFDINGTSGNNNIFQTNISSGTATSMTIGAGCEVRMSHCDVESSNAAVISGAGTLKYALISFIGSSSNVTVATQTSMPTLL